MTIHLHDLNEKLLFNFVWPNDEVKLNILLIIYSIVVDNCSMNSTREYLEIDESVQKVYLE